MIDQLLTDFGIHKSGMIVGVASNVIRAFETEFAENHDVKNAAIAALINVLEAHRNAPQVLAPVASAASPIPAPTPAPQLKR